MDNFNMVYRVVEGTSKQGSVSKSLREREKKQQNIQIFTSSGMISVKHFPIGWSKMFCSMNLNILTVLLSLLS